MEVDEDYITISTPNLNLYGDTKHECGIALIIIKAISFYKKIWTKYLR